MIGIIAGEIIGYPYSKNNLKSPNDIFFPLFEATRKGYFYNPKLPQGERKAANIDNIDKREQRNYIYREEKFAPSTGHLTDTAQAVAEMYINGETSLDSYSGGDRVRINPLVVAALCGMHEDNQAVAVETALYLINEVEPDYKVVRDISAMAALTWSAFHGGKREDLKRIADSYELEINHDTNNLRALLSGLIVPSDKKGIYTRGEGKNITQGESVVAAALQMTLQSATWEEAVRRAVAIGGESSLIAALTGGLAEGLYGDLPEHIIARTEDFLSRDLIETIERFERSSEALKQVTTAESNQVSFKVISKGDKAVYVIPEKDTDVINAVRKMRQKAGLDFILITPDQESEFIERLSIPTDTNGNRLSETYIEDGRIDSRTLFYDRKSKGIYSLTTIPSESMASLERRALEAAKLRELAQYAETVRRELEARVGHDSRTGHIHFSTAFYPVVGKEKVELWQGDILRARMRINEEGLLKVDTNVHTGSLVGEYLEGALNAAELARKNMGVAEFKALLDEYCLDYGAIINEDERRTLSEGGMDADSIAEIYKSNIDRAIQDMATSEDIRLDKAEMFTEKELLAAIVMETEQQYAEAQQSGRLREGNFEDAIWSKSHPGSVFTIGHSNMTTDEMLKLLNRFGIDVVLDIRSYTSSRFNPQFNEKDFSSFLETKGIGYEWFGDVFGGHMYYDKERQHRMTYSETLSTDRAKENLKAIRDAVKEGTRIAFMCSEAVPSQCHRYAMMGYALEHPADGRIKPIPVQHILRNGKLVSQTQLERSMLKTMGMKEGKESLKEAMEQKCKNLFNKTADDNPIRLTSKRRHK